MAQDVRRQPVYAASVVVACLLCAVPADTLAWGALGHRLVCAVALLQLDDDERAEIDRLASSFRGPNGLRYRYFTSGCTFADTARGRSRSGAAAWRRYAPFDRWHYLNVPRDARAVTLRHCDGNCVLTGIEHHFRQFANRDRRDDERAEAMLLMSHWIADVHQPLHVAFADDFGGNSVDVVGDVYDGDTLHEVWDRDVVDDLVGDRDWWSFAQSLSASITAGERRRWTATTPVAWAEESRRVAVDPRTGYCRTHRGRCRAIAGARRLDAADLRYATDVARERIRRAGARLAAFLSRGLR